jgi:hypothetical protein
VFTNVFVLFRVGEVEDGGEKRETGKSTGKKAQAHWPGLNSHSEQKTRSDIIATRLKEPTAS